MRAFLAIAGLMVAAIAVAIIIAFVRPNSSTTPDEPPKPPEQAQQSPKLMDPKEAVKGALRADLEIEGRGTIVLELYPAAAPKTVAHFVDLCNRHFYDGMLVHRVESNPTFKLFQTGDPASKSFTPERLRGKTNLEITTDFHLGSHGSGKSVPLEARLPNAVNSVGLARAQSEDSGDSQFYINLTDNHSFDGQYCVFGRVLNGHDVAASVQIGDRIHKLAMEKQ